MALQEVNSEDNRIIRSIYVDSDLWAAAIKKARTEKTSLSRVIRNALKAYVDQNK